MISKIDTSAATATSLSFQTDNGTFNLSPNSSMKVVQSMNRPVDRVLDRTQVENINREFKGYSQGKNGAEFPSGTSAMFNGPTTASDTAAQGKGVLRTIRPIEFGAGLFLPVTTVISNQSIKPDEINDLQEISRTSKVHALRFDLPNGSNFYISANNISINDTPYPVSNVVPLFDAANARLTIVSPAPYPNSGNLLVHASLMSYLIKENPAAARALQRALLAKAPSSTTPAPAAMPVSPIEPPKPTQADKPWF
jgi:hypothetical protein